MSNTDCTLAKQHFHVVVSAFHAANIALVNLTIYNCHKVFKAIYNCHKVFKATTPVGMTNSEFCEFLYIYQHFQ